MKRILITGSNSYIGNKFREWIEGQYNGLYKIDSISLRNEVWKQIDFSKYDAIFHTVGIAHRKERSIDKDVYYKVNCDLAYEVAKKAKIERVNHFVFLSSMSIYGLEEGIIHKSTLAQPTTLYGSSKLKAEELLFTLDSKDFNVAIIRPPMVYGEGCKGNYNTLSKFARNVPFFPNIKNSRSMIYIDNLTEFIRLRINNPKSGIFFPQNSEYVCTAEMVKEIRNCYSKTTFLVRIGGIISKFRLKNKKLNKIIGNLVYDKSLSQDTDEYNMLNFNNSIKKTEVGV
ncbi:NAD-dependent epimerase/dehydratase family protein [Rossellomorea marisflavi]|uniref:NAD-dependent epimerase/dehydratase family protein n=1 Tax=Rossellomorea marisflavi TaxID=189381 RepID=UPI003D2F1561